MFAKPFQQIFGFILGAMLLFSNMAFAEGSQCSSVFNESTVAGERGTDLKPLEWLRGLKQKFITSKVIKEFDQLKYEEHFNEIKSRDLKVEEGFVPKTLEESIAYLDVQLESLSISVAEMPPVMRTKAYKAVQSILKSNGKNAQGTASKLADIIFRGNFQKPTSFAYLLTHSPSQASREMFVQNLESIAVTQIVLQAYDFNPGPQKPGLMFRMTPQFLRNHKEAISTGFWSAVSVASSVHMGSADGLFLSPLNVFKLNKNRNIIEGSFVRDGFENTLVKLEPEFQSKNQFNYFYSVAVKACNWYIIGSLALIFVQ
ncbi:hypothetical protein DOM22_12995 [Bdellovibrio sp. ZAP7]|uniref:hypothetical protein n=1 Tax=Bdellovibrio sp. ZAP7 TaxID=2231053 RepID=UPI00115BB351|nr:hypothetical protein [Bdellovibrio sp. ZAP7]QDK46004.1 hypothetical protein DOM22_12995 [Bdellovibrio sp. ZAP7]